MINPEQDTGEQFFLDHVNKIAILSLNELSQRFLGDDAAEFIETIRVVTDSESEKGNAIPKVGMVNLENMRMDLVVETKALEDFADNAVDYATEGVLISKSDIVKLLLGAGAANAVLAWKTLHSIDKDFKEKIYYRDMICNKAYLWEAAASYDDDNDTSLRLAVEQLGDDQVPTINAIRFAVGVSLHYLNDSIDLQSRIPELFRPILVEQEESRAQNLSFLLDTKVFTLESLFDLYNKSSPELMYGLSFPMEPGEEIDSIFARG